MCLCTTYQKVPGRMLQGSERARGRGRMQYTKGEESRALEREGK